jgi:RNA polymerase sigma factor (sigma-70 family)
MTVKFDIAVRAKAKHGVLFRYMRQNNLTYNDMAELVGISVSTLHDIMHFRWLPDVRKDKSQHIIDKICKFFDCSFDEFLPPAVIEAIKNNRQIRQILQEEMVCYKEPQLEFLPHGELAQITCDSNFEDSIDQSDLIDKTLSTLTSREQKILRQLYWEEKTLEETAGDHDITRERVRQIHTKAIRKLRHPSRSSNLRELRPNHATFYPCAICDRHHLLKAEIKFLYIPGKLHKRNKAVLGNHPRNFSVCKECAKSFPGGIYTEEYTPPGELEKEQPAKGGTQKT